MIRFLRHFWEDRSGGPAAEFSLVLPVLLLFIFGTIDIGRFLYSWNQAEKATQTGARFAAVTLPVAGGNAANSLKNFSYAQAGLVPQGAPVDSANFGSIHCDGSLSTCSCTGCPGTMVTTFDTTSFGNIVSRMRSFKPDIVAADVFVDYDWSGLGYAGDPNGPDVAPMITVGLQNMQFRPITFFLLPVISLPSFRTTLSMEDGDGSASN